MKKTVSPEKYAELHCKSNYSFLTGASHPGELIRQADELGYAAIAITDLNSVAGVVQAFMESRTRSIRLIVGAEMTPIDAPPIVLWATDRKSYGQLCRLISTGRRRAPKGECEIGIDDIANYSAGLIGGVKANASDPIHHDFISKKLASSKSGSPNSTFNSNVSQNVFFDFDLRTYRDIFPDRCYLLAEPTHGVNDAQHLSKLNRLSKISSIPLVAAGDVHYHTSQRKALHDVLVSIRNGTTVAEAGDELLSNAMRHLQTIERRTSVFADYPDAITRTIEIADRCIFQLDELRYEYPEELAPNGQKPIEFLRELSWAGARRRYPTGIPPKVKTLIDHELELIEELHYEAYFLTVWDLVRFAREREILCQGRGSAANSAICFCLEVTSVDPATTDVLFERFISRERNEAPDIDVDFEHQRREEVLQYLYEKYGRERAGLAATVITYRTRSAIRDVGKAIGLSLDRVDTLAKYIGGRSGDGEFVDRMAEVGIDPNSRTGKQLVHLVGEIHGFPRHLSQHVGGMVMTQGPLCELVPIENASMDGRTVIQWDKDDLEELGILKVDCLCLGMLSAIRRCFEMVNTHYGRTLSLANIPQGDPNVYDMICDADTIGVFQIESRAQMSMLPRLRPRCYYDLVIEVAIVRPGPIQGNMVHPYLRRRNGEEKVVYPNAAIEAVLHKTMGVPIFQEQAMKLAVVAAGFTPGEADQLRRAMGAWRRPGIIDKFHQKLMKGMKENGLSEEFANNVFSQIRGFGEYGFPESHAASFALLVYVSAYLKHYYPAVFCAGLINSQPMGFYAPAQLIKDAQRHGVKVLPIDVNHSDWDCTLETDIESSASNEYALRMGFRLVSGLRHESAMKILESRDQVSQAKKSKLESQNGAGQGSFQSLAEFTRRTKLSQTSISKLAEADAFGSLNRDRRSALWESLAQDRTPLVQPLFDAVDDDDDWPADLPQITEQEQVFTDYNTIGLSLRSHPISFYRESLDQLRVKKASELESIDNNRFVRVAGIVLLRQRPSTAKGITFVTLEDETGTINLVLHQQTWNRYYKIARSSNSWIVNGKVEKKHAVIHVIVGRLQDLSEELDMIQTKSRDFR
ncbi:error-prone DNA polymerase [Pirellulaceae bacterium]|nr:error-prone DNA polymerase [Pirellulaceae bacterium]